MQLSGKPTAAPGAGKTWCRQTGLCPQAAGHRIEGRTFCGSYSLSGARRKEKGVRGQGWDLKPYMRGYDYNNNNKQ